MITGATLHQYELKVGLWCDQGWGYGPCALQVAGCRRWWVACPVCGAVAVATWRELSSEDGVICLEQRITAGRVSWCDAAVRPLRWQPTQEEATAAFLLGGHEAVKALVAGEPGPVIEPVGAHLQEAEPEAP